jgi:MYXO-CTERM domain-containing protein
MAEDAVNASTRNSILGAGVGLGLMYLLDPARGARRRALIRDKLVQVGRKTRDAAGATARDMANRTAGVRARAATLINRRPVSDDVLVERVRARLGRVASHPRAIDVVARGGCVTLAGDVLATELAPILSAVTDVRGVKDVENQMTAHATTDGVPSLQGESERPAQWLAWSKSGWSPTAKVVGGAALLAVAGAAAARRRM